MIHSSIVMEAFYFICIYFALVTSVNSFSWDSCGSLSDPVKVIQLNVTENDAREILVTARGKLAVNITSPVKGTLEMRKKLIWGWTKIPCVDGFGSCNYDDICALSPYPDSCPQIFVDNNLPCHCPITQGSYAAKNFPINLAILPKWLEKGRYKLKAVLSTSDKQLICLEVDITL